MSVPTLTSPSIWARIYRALLYLFVTAIVVASGLLFRRAAGTNRLTHDWWVLNWWAIEWWHVVATLALAFCVSLTYVNVYVLPPEPGRMRHRSTAAIYVILVFALGLVAVFWHYLFNTAGNVRIKAFVMAFALVPSAAYVVSVFIKSGFFYSRDVANRKVAPLAWFSEPDDDRLFLFRHQLVTPGMLLITIPFCVAYAIAHDVRWREVYWMMAGIETIYFGLCFAPRTTVAFGFGQARLPVNVFFAGCIALFIAANIAAISVPGTRFVLFAVWMGLYLTSFEYWTSIYFKSTENTIRRRYGLTPIDLGADKYFQYFAAAAWSFTFICVFFATSFLLDGTFSLWYVTLTFALTLGVWAVWLERAARYSVEKDLFALLRRFKVAALLLPLIILVESGVRSTFRVDTTCGGNPIAYVLTMSLSLYVFVPLGVAALVSRATFLDLWRRSRLRFYWVAGVGMALVCIALVLLKDINPQRMLALAWVYFFAHLVPFFVFVYVERANLTFAPPEPSTSTQPVGS